MFYYITIYIICILNIMSHEAIILYIDVFYIGFK